MRCQIKEGNKGEKKINAEIYKEKKKIIILETQQTKSKDSIIKENIYTLNSTNAVLDKREK